MDREALAERPYHCRVVPDAIVSNPRPASTVIVLRDSSAGPEVFMVRRHQDTAFMGGAYVFPGGRVDAADHDGSDAWCDGLEPATAQLSSLDAEVAVAFHVAAARELFEEAGVLLARDAGGNFVSLTGDEVHARFNAYRLDVHGGRATLRSIVEREQLRLALDALVLFAHWVTPPIDTRQFDTRFFMARVPPDQTPAHDETETTHSSWLTPSYALAQAVSSHIVLPVPTWTTIRELERFATVDAAMRWAKGRRVVARMPLLITQDDGTRLLVIPGDPLYPEENTGDMPMETRFAFVDQQWRAVSRE
jgi:8-oxo-dGTP pyrophosphatase MutT (NUDIX family)